MTTLQNNLYIIDLIYKNNGEIVRYMDGINDIHLFIFKQIVSISYITNIEIYKEYLMKVISIYKNNYLSYSQFTLYDLYVYSSYIIENYIISYGIFQLIMNNISDFENKKANVRKLYLLDDLLRMYNIYVCDDSKRKHITYIRDDKNYEYINKFVYFVNFSYIKLKYKKIYVQENLHNITLFLQDFDKMYISNIENLYSYINQNINTFTFYELFVESKEKQNDLLYFIDHVITISNNDLYEIFVKKVCNNSSFTESECIYILYTIMRCIYSKDLKMVKIYEENYINHTFENIFFIYDKNINQEYEINYQQYVNDIIHFMNNIQTNIATYMYHIIYKYVNETYMCKKNNCVNKDCCICLESMNDTASRFSHCTFCNNYYHENCFIGLMEKHSNCALCRKNLFSYSIKNSTFKYFLFKNILTNMIC